jgi:Transposase IS66 family
LSYQTVREKFSCRECEKITQPPAPFHVTPRGFVGPNLLAMILFEKFGQHQPLNRQSERYAREGIDLSVSSLADQVGACTTVLQPPHALIEAHVLAAERLHGDDTRRCRSWPKARRPAAYLGLCARRPALWRDRAAVGALLRLSGSKAGTSRAPSSTLPHGDGRLAEVG